MNAATDSTGKDLRPRPRYLQLLVQAQDNGMIKVITGMRHCGKSTLMELFKQHLANSGTAQTHIVHMNLESYEFADFTAQQLHEAITQRAPRTGHWYLLLDEIQLVDGWERVINGLRVDCDVDITITGSNAHLLSGELATLLSGRTVDINMYPLSYAEFLSYTGCQNEEQTFDRFVRYGGLPPVVDQGTNQPLAKTVLSGIYDTVLVRDVTRHIQVRDTTALNDISRYLASTAGSSVSVTNIEQRLKSAHRKTSGITVERYIQGLVNAYLFRRARRQELRGGELLQGLSKYYPADLGIRNMLLGFPTGDYGFALENLVHNELVGAGYEVRVGKADSYEIDFVAERIRGDMTRERLYVQVSASVMEPQTRERELRAFRKLTGESGRKLVVTLDRLGLGFVDGVEIVNALDWLLTL